jgi:hypothetical protein
MVSQICNALAMHSLLNLRITRKITQVIVDSQVVINLWFLKFAMRLQCTLLLNLRITHNFTQVIVDLLV